MISSIPSAGFHMYGVALEEEMISFPGHHSLDEQITHPTVLPSPQTSLLHNFSLLKDKVAQLNSFLNLFISSGTQDGQLEAATVSVSTMAILLQDILSTASSMMFSCQQMALNAQNGQLLNHDRHGQKKNYSNNISHHSSTGYPPKSNTNDNSDRIDYGTNNSGKVDKEKKFETIDEDDDDMINLEAAFDKELENGAGDSSCYDIVEMGADDLLAEYTHYCHICGKGFKRDANLRMHMRAHGDEYKSNASLSKPFSAMNGSSPSVSSYGNNTAPPPPRKYSCPHEGCRWNKRHAKFTPLKSMICVKNHYKRSHCPKMYVCNRCNKKKFSVLSDLRTHEKHCGDLKWQCSCGTTFSRKDKLLGHIALFVGHTPAGNCAEKIDRQANVIEGFSNGRT